MVRLALAILQTHARLFDSIDRRQAGMSWTGEGMASAKADRGRVRVARRGGTGPGGTHRGSDRRLRSRGEVGVGDAVIDPVIGRLFNPPYALLLGRRTYDIFAAY